MWLKSGFAFRLPSCSGLRDRLIRFCFILAENHHPGAFPSLVRLLNQGFFFLGLWIVDDHDAFFTHSLGGSCRAPGAALLIRIASF